MITKEQENIIELNKQNKSIREIADMLNISKNKVHRVLKSGTAISGNGTDGTDGTDKGGTSGTAETAETEDPNEVLSVSFVSNCPFGRDKNTCELYKETNNKGIRKLRQCDYKENKGDLPYFDCNE